MEKEKSIDYFNGLLNRLEEIFYHELSGCARPKSELVGIDFLSSKNIQGSTLEELVDNCINVIKESGIAKDISYSIHGFDILIKFQVKNCIHLPKEIKIKKEGIEPYCCPIANMILDQILEKLNYLTVYTAGIEVHEDKEKCILKCAVYKSMDKIGQVSDWTKC